MLCLLYFHRVKELRRQGGVRGGRRGKTLPSPKHNLSNSSSSTVGTRGKSPPKKAKLGRQREAFGPTSRTTSLSTGEAILCSTPKNSRWGEETSPGGGKGIGFEHITPVRGWLGTADKRERVKIAGKQEVRERDNERTDSHSVSCLKGRAGVVLGQPTDEREGHKEHLSITQRESAFSRRKTLKVGREEERKLIEQQRQVDNSRDTCREAEMQNERDFKKANEKDKEKERHLRWYHQQLQQFIPSSASSSVYLSSPFQCSSFSSSNQASLSSSVSSTSCSSLQQPSRLSLSALMYHSLEEVLEEYRAGAPVRAVDNRGQLPFLIGEIYQQLETSSSYNNNNNENAHGNFGGVGKDCRLLWERTEARFGQDMDESEKRRLVKTTSKGRARQEDKTTAGIEGGERRWAWVATTETQHADRMTGAVTNTVEPQVSYTWDSEDRREVDKEGLTASANIPADGLWSTEEGGEADSCSLVSAHSNSASNTLLNTSPFKSSHQRAPAERPFSPACELTNTILTPNKLSDVSFESKHTRCTSNILPLPLQNTPQAVPSGSHREKEQGFGTNANRRQFSNSQSTTQPLTTSITQIGCQKTAKPLSKLCKNPVYTQEHHHPEVKLKISVLPQDETSADSLSCIMDPLSISLLQVDQQVATASFLQGEQNNTSVCLQKKDISEGNRRRVEEDNFTCSEMLGNVVENEEPLLELPQPKTQCPLTSDTVTAINYTEHTHKPQIMQAIEVLSNKAPAPPLNLSTYASMQTSVVQSFTPSVQYSSNTCSSNSHNLIPNDAPQIPPQYGHNMYSKSASSISTQQSESVLGHLNTAPSQCHTVHSHHLRDLNNSLKLNSPTESNGQERTSSQQVRPIIHLSTLEDMNHAQ